MISIEERRRKDRERAKKSRALRKQDPERLAKWNKYKMEYYYSGGKKGRVIDGRSLDKCGLTYAAYELLEKWQDYKCAICGEDETTMIGSTKRRMAVDHDHKCCTGSFGCLNCIRGLLCGRCNRAIGLFGDDPELLRKAVEYLDKGGTGDVEILKKLDLRKA